MHIRKMHNILLIGKLLLYSSVCLLVLNDAKSVTGDTDWSITFNLIKVMVKSGLKDLAEDLKTDIKRIDDRCANLEQYITDLKAVRTEAIAVKNNEVTAETCSQSAEQQMDSLSTVIYRTLYEEKTFIRNTIVGLEDRINEFEKSVTENYQLLSNNINDLKHLVDINSEQNNVTGVHVKQLNCSMEDIRMAEAWANGKNGDLPKDCLEIIEHPEKFTNKGDGVYKIRTWRSQTVLNVFCNMTFAQGGWTVRHPPYFVELSPCDLSYFPYCKNTHSPHGHYFVSGGHDRVARLWTTDHYQPIRMFAGHFSDVDCVQFHPNGNYVATGSSDRAVRIFDVLNGSCVRTLTGHKGAIHSFSPDGKYLATSGLDGVVCLWDISNGNMLAQMKDHSSTIYSLCFSRCGSVLASGGLDNCVKLWDVTKVIKETDKDMDASIPSSLSVNENPNLLIGSFSTKATSVLPIHFTRKNLLLAAGPMKVS